MLSVLRCCMIGLALLILTGASDAETRSFSVTSPAAGFQFSIDDGSGGELMLLAHGRSNVVGSTLHPACPPRTWQVQPLVQGRWLSLSLATSNTEQAARIGSWLDAPLSALRPAGSAREFLRRSVLALDAGLGALAPVRGRPGQLQFVLHLSEGDCQLGVQQEMTAAQAREMLTFPLAASEAVLRMEMIGDLQLLEVLRIMVHESAHMLQMYPYDAQRALSHQQGRPFQLHGDHAILSLDVELGALMVERCLMQGMAPEPRYAELHAMAWRDRPSVFHLDMTDPGMRRMYAEHFENQRRVLGKSFVGVRDDARLAKLFAFCAMALARDSSLRDQTPDETETARGLTALRALRGWVTEPYIVEGMDYSMGPLTRAEQGLLQRRPAPWKKVGASKVR